MGRDYSFWRGSWELVKLFFGVYREQHDTMIQHGGYKKMTKKKEELCISDLIQLLGEKEGMVKAGYIYNCYSNRYDAKHETDNVSQEDYLRDKTLHFANYLRAYYNVKVPAPKKTKDKSPVYVGKTLDQENLEDKASDKMNYRW